MIHPYAQIGRSLLRLDGAAKVAGRTHYTADIVLPDMIFGKCLRSPFPHARIVAIDSSEAKRMKGVRAVLTAADLPQRLIGRRLKDMPVLARGVVRFVGDRVAAVAADSADLAEDALNRIHVEYEELRPVFDPIDAMSADAPILHEDLASYENLNLPLPSIPNVHSHTQLRFGDTEAGFRESDIILEQTFTTQRVHHGYLEPHAVVVAVDRDERISIWYPAKGPYAGRQQLAEWLQVDETRIVFQLSPVGGDFGGKGSLMDVPICTMLVKATGKPVKMVMSYSEELTAGNPRHPSVIKIKTGLKKDGKFRAREVNAIFDSGAYAGLKNNETVNLPGARHGAGAYYIPHVRIDAYSVYTNCVPSGIMRGPGEAQMIFAVESHTDYVARQLGIDPFRLRALNTLRRGDSAPYGMCLRSDRGTELLEEMAGRFGWHAAGKRKPLRGKGLALCVREVGAGVANVELGLTREGKLYLLTTVPDTGTGAHTIFRQIAAEILGVSADTIEVVLGTTDSFPTDVTVAASRVTFLGGQATQRAALQLLNLLTEQAARYFGCPASGVTRGHDLFHSAAKEKLSLSELALKAFSDGITLSSKGNFKMEQRTGSACFFGQAAEVEVDAETGKVTILKMLSAYDVGTIINPLAHQGQVEGGMIQGLGFALIENLVDEEGRIATANLGEYKIPNILDVPKHETLLINDNEGPGPFQSKPIGEHSAVPTAPCIANAVYDALGVQITDLPLDAEKIYFALKNRAPVPCEHRVPATERRPSRQGSHRKNRRV